ncbi:SIR2 family protein [Pseudomonas koreensis]|uniref:SIR2 family NAD-dependent protein deacylase n=1 Tax=Pseudomonas koreensis TaxID=198620 RepID=UPI0015756B9F|nr:SIR2 family protein [Pseudomonas koreensis]
MTADEIILLERANKLPDFALIKKLATALWRQDSTGHGAAIMLGAGFTRCAAQSGDISKAPPLWLDLSKRLAEELDPSNMDLPYSDPLRLAEEYRAHFGHQTMVDLLRGEINDASWSPGELHKTVLSFPWTDVLTTNWDTLLERAATSIHTPIYNTVTKPSDLSYFRAPRIVKLHGTIDTTEDLIFTQEDYRKYPQTHAAFVNLSRQIFIENELCLLGFSGEDPNFLQWAGWVRDNLTKNAHKIYLIGALKLTPAKRKYLESLNVAPIDLWGLVDDYDDHNLKHIKATEAFFLLLTSLKPKDPSNWRPSRLEGTATPEQIINTLKADRKSYPGWLVCPHAVRWDIQTQLSGIRISPDYINNIPKEQKESLLYEICWQHSKTYEILPDWLVSELIQIYDPATRCSLTIKQQLEIALLILKNSRWHTYTLAEEKSVSNIATNLLLQNLKHYPEVSNEVNYHLALISRDNFDYGELEKLVDKIDDRDPIWKIKKASLLGELGRFDEGENLISSAFAELQDHHRKDRKSIYVFSRLAWAHFIIQGVRSNYSTTTENTSSQYKKWKCDPWNHLDHIDARVSKSLETHHQQKIEALFNPGSYKDNANQITFSNEIHLVLLVDGITRETGLPIRWDNINFIKNAIENITLLDSVGFREKFTLSILASNYEKSKSIKSNFSRIKIACIEKNEIDIAIHHCFEAINYWREKYNTKTPEYKRYCVEKLRVFIEILSRLLIRASPEMAQDMFVMATEMGHETYSKHPWIHEPLKNLLNNSLLSIPPDQHGKVLLHSLKFPLPNVQLHLDAPNPIVENPGTRPKTSEYDQIISDLIRTVSLTSNPSRPLINNPIIGVPESATIEMNKVLKRPLNSTSALSRLLPLVINNFTTDLENQKLSEALYGKDFDYTALPSSDFYPHVFWSIPTDAPEKLTYLISNTLFKNISNTDPLHLQAIIYAAKNKKMKFFPSALQAIEHFENLTQWCPPGKSESLFANDQSHIGGLIGQALAYSIVPALPADELTPERYEKIRNFLHVVDFPSIVFSMVFFVKNNEAIEIEVSKLIRRLLQEKKQDNIIYATLAAFKLRELSDSTHARSLISRIIYLVGSGRKTGLSYILRILNDSTIETLLSDEDFETLSDSLQAIYEESKYEDIDPNSSEVIDASVIRSECVKLAKKITILRDGNYQYLETLIEDSLHDPLPEVRFSSLIN